MRHYLRTQLSPDRVLALADQFFPRIAPARTASDPRRRTFVGELGRVSMFVWKEGGGHYTFIDATTDQVGESRLDRNVKRFFVTLHQAEFPSYRLTSAF